VSGVILRTHHVILAQPLRLRNRDGLEDL
jgi:hypothetical protein